MLSIRPRMVAISRVYPLLLLISVASFSFSQTSPIPKYRMVFELKDGNGSIRDTAITKSKLDIWSKSGNFPSYVKWKGHPFQIANSPIDGLGLYTDSTSSFQVGDTIAYVYFKFGSTGKFKSDYLESAVGHFINHSLSPNGETLLTPQGIILIARQDIPANTEITSNYLQLVALFPNDPSVSEILKF